MQKRCKVENYRGGGPPSPQEERRLPNQRASVIEAV